MSDWWCTFNGSVGIGVTSELARRPDPSVILDENEGCRDKQNGETAQHRVGSAQT